ncbi:preprotein translocase subunit YajC [Kitasatospora nipponensis]|uniref:Preprotein translocase subunit YajC n=1 Tax=Kitasatospora nipponensis TaxID=258049 RepID=A0ABN1W733_9ACTN
MITLIIPLFMVGAIVLMMRSQKKRQQQVQSMQSAMEPGSAVRTIGGLYATVKSINDSTVELEIAPGVITHFAKSAVAAVIDPQEYDEIINGRPEGDEEAELADVEPIETEDDTTHDEAVSLDKGEGDKPVGK